MRKSKSNDTVKTITTLADLSHDPKNARRHTPRNVGMIEQALGEVGAARSIVIDEAGVVLAGNATIDAAARAGIERVQVVDGDGETIIAVRRSGLTAAQKARLALYDNRAAELAEWDADQIAAMIAEDEKILDGIWLEGERGFLVEPTDIMEEWEGMPGYDNEDLGAVRSIKVNFATLEDLDRFFAVIGQSYTEKTKFIWYPKKERADLISLVYSNES